MAGGKETPRQKMIGMMYLVLTALLALQVSSAIIEKFIFLNESLEYTVSEADKRNQSVVGRIKKAVTDAGNRPQDLAVLKGADEVRDITSKMITELDGLKKDLITKSGGIDPETGSFKGAKEEEAVAIYMVGGKKNGKAYELKGKLNKFAEDLSKYHSTKFAPLALDGDQDPMFKNKPDQKNKDFAELNFAQTPMVAALAVLSQKESEIRRMESQALEDLAGKVGAQDLKFDNIYAMSRAESKVVAAGTKYKAEMFIAASSSGIRPSMKFNGSDVKVENGKGLVEFTAQAGDYDKDGNAKKVWKGSITFKNPSTGRDTTFTLEQEYVVAKPVIQVQSASVQALYLNCGNELNIQVPALGSVYDPSFSASGAQVIKGANKGLVTVIPNAAQVTLNVSSGGNAIGSEKFQVRTIPKPTIEVLAAGRPVNEKQGMAMPRSLEIRAVPDESFKNFLPKDARYKIYQWEVTLARGARPVQPPITVTAESVSLSSLAAQARPGDRLVIEVKEVKRMNFKGEIETVKMPTIYKNVSIN
jgi:gliding motility-associated protein GldM